MEAVDEFEHEKCSVPNVYKFILLYMFYMRLLRLCYWK